MRRALYGNGLRGPARASVLRWCFVSRAQPLRQMLKPELSGGRINSPATDRPAGPPPGRFVLREQTAHFWATSLPPLRRRTDELMRERGRAPFGPSVFFSSPTECGLGAVATTIPIAAQLDHALYFRLVR